MPALTPEHFSRRSLFQGGLCALLGLESASRLAAEEPKPDVLADDAEVTQVKALASNAGLGSLNNTRTAHFLAVGDAPESYQREALKLCEALGEAFLTHFRGRGFSLQYPERRLTVVALKDGDSYAALLGKAPGKFDGGHFDLETNRLVQFDFRSQKDQIPNAEEVNLFTLVHETAHQLSFNTGMLMRHADVPVCVSEGLATYVELWRPQVKNLIGGINRKRMEALRQAADWISIAELLGDDELFKGESEQLAYAESWLLIHYLLRSSSRQRFRQYVSEVQARNQARDRSRIAEQVLGSLKKLDRELKDEARKYLRN